jgi:tRNA1(Val) A37 N6-methylase TrmN6
MGKYFDFFNSQVKLTNGPGCYKITEDSLWLLSALPLDQKTYLEVGCATGVISLLLRLKNKQARVTAIDIQKDMIAQALEHLNINDIEDIDFSVQDLYSLEGSKYDCVFSNPPFLKMCACCDIIDDVKKRAHLQENIVNFLTKMLEFVKDDGFLCFIGHCTTRQDILDVFKDKHTVYEYALISKEGKEAKRYVYVVKKDGKNDFSCNKIDAYHEKIRKNVLQYGNSLVLQDM